MEPVPGVRRRVVDEVFKGRRVQQLVEYVDEQAAAAAAAGAPWPAVPVVLESDPAEFRNFVFTTLVVDPSGPQPSEWLTGDVRASPWVKRCSIRDVLFRVVSVAVSADVPNVLALGHRKEFGGRHGSVCLYPNTLHKIILGPNWDLLLTRIGDALLLHMLLRLCVFTPLPNGCFFQLSGPATCELLQSWRKFSPLRPAPKHVTIPKLVTRKAMREKDATDIHGKKPADTSTWLQQHGRIPRSLIFYSFKSHIGFPEKHILNSLKSATFCDGAKLLCSIFYEAGDIPMHTKKFHQLEHIIPLLQKLLRRQATCKYYILFNACCVIERKRRTTKGATQKAKDAAYCTQAVPVAGGYDSGPASWQQGSVRAPPSLQAGTRLTPQSPPLSPPPPTMDRVLAYHLPHGCVLRFVAAVLRHVVPVELWGSKANFKAFLKNLWLFVSMNRKEGFSLDMAIRGIKLSECQWLQLQAKQEEPQQQGRLPPNFWARCHLLLAKLIYWIYVVIVIPLLRGHFYCTETTVTKHKICYYPQAVWKLIQKAALMPLVNTLYSPLARESAEKLMVASGLPCATLRFLPKVKDLRPILNLGRKSGPQRQSVNSRLKTVQHIVTFEKGKDNSLFGASLLSPGDAYIQVLHFVKKYREMKAKQPSLRLFFATVDVKNSFNNLNQHTLVDNAHVLLTESEYLVQRFAKVSLAARPLACPSVKYERTVHASYPQFSTSAVEMSARAHNVIFIDKVEYTYIPREQVEELVKHHIVDTVVKIGNDYYRQKSGMPQGSVLSSLLCNLSYSEMEKDTLSDLPTHGGNMEEVPNELGLLLRMIDDSLYVSTQQRFTETFIHRVAEGHPKYGYYVNRQKCRLNFIASFKDGTPIPQFSFDSGGLFVPWCGLLFDSDTMEIRYDYSRWTATSMQNSITVDKTRNPGLNMQRMLLSTIKLKVRMCTAGLPFWLVA
eukprot:TRINITY_DN4932_c0_g1_i2.p1 TRINITY_DN4932_c0_g1~~TRINITY_DN4932_c0_g1_i2.p1  ORF type:complete len:947 (+),score=178.54 TRINITY_DN4932_c0_g1_i2:2-2842(+)